MEININFNIFNKIIKTDGILILILITATLLRFFNIGFQDAWLDEIHTLKESDPFLSFSELHQIIIFREGTPHFYFLTVRFLSEVFGSNILVARSVSAVAGVLAVYFIFKLGKELYNKNVGYLAAIFLTFNVFHITYSQEARSYSILTFFIIIAFYFLIKFIKKPNIKTAILLGLFSGLITNAQPIGLLNVLSIYLILLIGLFLQDKNKRKIFFLQSFLAGILTLVVFSPVYQIIAVLSNIKQFWVAAPTFEGIKNVFINISGNSFPLLIITLLFLCFILFNVIKHYKQEKTNSNLNLSVITLLVWIFVCSTVLIVKSYLGPSLILQRYFIGILPAFILILAIGIELIASSILKKVSMVLVLALLILSIFKPNFYYTTITKTQFSTICNEVKKNNTNNEKIISNWGWLLSYYLDRENKFHNVLEINLENYLLQVKEKALDQESFWYIDGNSRPYDVSPEIQEFISKEFIVDKSIQYFDTWAMHFIPKKQKASGEVTLNLSNFSNAQFDGLGKLMFFESGNKDYPPFYLDKGEYEIEILGKSTPEVPIDGENAKMNLLINNKRIANFELSQKENSKLLFKYKQVTSGSINLKLEFINDFSKENLDRNAQISTIKFKKIE